MYINRWSDCRPLTLSDMASTEKFCLRWNDFETNISKAFKDIREEKDFFDVTLACDDDQISAHKVILSACSPFFRTILKRNKHEHPLLYLKGVQFSDLQAVLNFMYHGEVNVAQEDLNTFLAVAEDLKVKGLTQSDTPSNNSPSSTKPTLKSKAREPPEQALPPAKKPRASNPPPPVVSRVPSPPHDDDDIQEIPPVKSEPVVQMVPEPVAVSEGPVEPYGGELVSNDYDEDYGGDYEGAYDTGDGTYDGTGLVDPNSSNADGNKGEAEMYMTSLRHNGIESWQCLLCSKISKRKYILKDHVDSIHLAKSDNTCQLCGKVYLTKNSLQNHMSTYHKNVNSF